MRARRRLIQFGGIALAFLMLTVLPAAAQAPGTGIEGTAHDFSANSSNSVTVGVCTFCHTPHRALQTRLLWNHTLSSNTFSWDTTTTMGDTPMPTIAPAWQGPSKFCLSCHDGSVAIGDVAWFRAATRTGGSAINSTAHDGDIYQIATTSGSMAGNHPVAHPFPFGNAPSTYNSVTTGAQAALSGWQADPTVAGIRLFTDVSGNVSAGTGPGITGIECSSCHDPHNGSQVQDVYFLRGAIDGDSGSGYICLKCHNK